MSLVTSRTSSSDLPSTWTGLKLSYTHARDPDYGVSWLSFMILYHQRVSMLKIPSQGPLQAGRYLSDGRWPSWPLSSSCPILGGHTALVFTPTLSAPRIDEQRIEPVLQGAQE